MSDEVDVIGFIADRAHIAEARIAAETLCEGRRGDGWTHGVNLFEQTEHPYLFMLAENRARCRLGAPVVMIAPSVEGLYAAIGAAADNVIGQGMWLRFLDEATDTPIRPLLANCAEGGKVTEHASSGAVREYRNGVRTQ